MRVDVTKVSARTAAVAFGMDGKARRYEFVGRKEGILLGICRLYSYVERYGTCKA